MGLEFEEYKEIFPLYYISNFGNIKHDNNFLKNVSILMDMNRLIYVSVINMLQN